MELVISTALSVWRKTLTLEAVENPKITRKWLYTITKAWPLEWDKPLQNPQLAFSRACKNNTVQYRQRFICNRTKGKICWNVFQGLSCSCWVQIRGRSWKYISCNVIAKFRRDTAVTEESAAGVSALSCELSIGLDSSFTMFCPPWDLQAKMSDLTSGKSQRVQEEVEGFTTLPCEHFCVLPVTISQPPW